MQAETPDLQEKKTLREWREDAGLTQRELGELVGTTQAYISDLEVWRRPIDVPVGRSAMEILGISETQILPPPGIDDEEDLDWSEDGFSSSAPKRNVAAWRLTRCMSRRQLVFLSGLSRRAVSAIENNEKGNIRPLTRRKLARALRVDPGKLILPGDNIQLLEERSREDFLRSELRGKTKALKKCYDFLIQDSNLSFKALDSRDALVRDVEKELKGA